MHRVMHVFDRSGLPSTPPNDLTRRQDFVRALVDTCFLKDVVFKDWACQQLSKRITAMTHRPLTWAVSLTNPEEGEGSFLRRMVTCVSPPMKIRDVLPSLTGWSTAYDASKFGAGVYRCTPLHKVLPAGWHGVGCVLRMYEQHHLALLPRSTSVSRPVWENLALREIFAAEAFAQSAPALLVCNPNLFQLIMAFCYWG
jgi:hypothetical protein